MYLYRLTTPTHTFTLPIDTNECSVIQVIYKQGDNVLIKEYKLSYSNIKPLRKLINGSKRLIFRLK